MSERSRLKSGLEALVLAARQANLPWAEHMALNNVAVELAKFIEEHGKDENEGTADGGASGGL